MKDEYLSRRTVFKKYIIHRLEFCIKRKVTNTSKNWKVIKASLLKKNSLIWDENFLKKNLSESKLNLACLYYLQNLKYGRSFIP